MKTGAYLSFEGGSLHIKRNGYPDDKRGEGEFTFDDNDLDWPTQAESEAEARCRSIRIPRSELEAIRDFITETLDALDESAEPCTDAARNDGCTCRMSSVNSASIDPPHEIVDPWCPLHGGRDPDRERDERMDREADGGFYGDGVDWQ